MDWKNEIKIFLYFIIVFLIFFFLPVEKSYFTNAVLESLKLTKWYAQEHVIFCLIPAFFVSGALTVFINQNSIIKYFGPTAPKIVSYSIASISGIILAVCSCTILPLFAGIYMMGAGLGPAITFLYSGPAINILAIVMTIRVIGLEIGLARAIGAILFSIIIGLIMQFLFLNENQQENKKKMVLLQEENRPLWQIVLFFLFLISILVFANWSDPQNKESIWFIIYNYKWFITAISFFLLGIVLVLWFELKLWKVIVSDIIILIAILLFHHDPMIPFVIGIISFILILSTEQNEMFMWLEETWKLAKQILPYLFIGVLIAGFFLGRPGHSGIIPEEWIKTLVGGNSFLSNLFSSFLAAFMYFATLTEIPILQGLMGSGMGEGPALALLLAGPALSLPSILVIRSVMGTKKTIVYVGLVIIMSTIAGYLYCNYIL